MTPEPSSPAVALPAPLGVVAPAERARPDMRLLGLLALGPMVIDINQGSLPAILPFIKDALNLSYAATGVIVLTANVTSSLIQPLFGYLADKTARRWLLPLSVLLSAVGLAFTGLAPSYPAVLALVMVTGFGVAAYHPEGYRTATAVAGERKATGVSIFSTGGNIRIPLRAPRVTALPPGLKHGLPPRAAADDRAPHRLRPERQSRHAGARVPGRRAAHRGAPAALGAATGGRAGPRQRGGRPDHGRRDEPAHPGRRDPLMDPARLHHVH